MFASIFIPHFPVQSLTRSDPELLGKAVAVVDGKPPLFQVVDANASALTAGVEMGMAKLKVEHFYSGVAIRMKSVVQETSAHAALLDCANAFSPRVEDSAPDLVVIDLDGLERLFGSYQEIAAQIYDQTILVGLQPNISIAANADAAIQASRGFEGISVIADGTERDRLADLPLELLSSELAFIETLHRWGIRTFGAFAKLPATKVSERLGQDGVRLHRLARGTNVRPLNPYQESLRFEEAMELDYEITLLEPLTFILSRLLDQICCRLRVRNRATHEIHVRLDSYERILRLPLPICDAKLLVKLLMLDLESNPPKDGVSKVVVEAIPTRPRTVQNGLFTPLAPEPEKLQLTLARIKHIVGTGNVGSPELVDTHRPDSLVNTVFQGTGVGVITTTKRWLPPVAFRWFRPALEATVQLRKGTPVWVAFHGVFGPVPHASGPWNSSGDWWNEDRWSREEWDITIEARTKGIGMYRIYRDVASNRWFAEGVYD